MSEITMFGVDNTPELRDELAGEAAEGRRKDDEERIRGQLFDEEASDKQFDATHPFEGYAYKQDELEGRDNRGYRPRAATLAG